MKCSTPLVALLFVCLAAAPLLAEPPAAASLLPDSAAEALIVGSVDFRDMQEHDLLTYAAGILPLILMQVGVPDFFDELNFDLTTDLHTMAYAVSVDFDEGPDKVIVVLTGKFEGSAILNKLAGFAEMELQQFGELELLPANYEMFFGIIDDTAVVFGHREWIEEAAARLAGPNRAETQTEARLKLHTGTAALQVYPAGLPKEVWEAAQMVGIRQPNIVSAGVAARLKTITQLNLNLEAKAIFEQPEHAQQVYDKAMEALEEAIAEAPMLQVIVNELPFERQENVLIARVEMPASAMLATAPGILIPIGIRAAAPVPQGRAVMAEPMMRHEGVVVHQQAANPGNPEERAACENHLMRLGLALHVHVLEQQDGSYPRNLQQMVDNEVLLDMSLLICPSDRHAFAPGEWYTSYQTLFELADRPIVKERLANDVIVVWDRLPRHGNVRNVLTAGGTVRYVVEHDFQRLVRTARRAAGID